MTAEYTSTVARVIDAHTPTGSGGDITCWCNQRFESWAEHAMHVAPLILSALELREESLTARLKAFGRDCVGHGDMTPGAARMLNRILDGEQ